MDYYQDWQYEEYENTQEQYPNYNYEYKSDNKRSNYLSQVAYVSKYSQNPYMSSSKRQQNTAKKQTVNQYRNYQTEKKDYNKYSNISQEYEPRNSTKYYSDHNKYLTLFNSETKRYERSNENLSNDGVLRGYTDNCSFYISGSSDIKPKTTIKNKFLNKNNNSDIYNRYNKNYQLDNRDNRQKKVYESRTQVINPTDYTKTEVQQNIANKYNKKNDNKYNNKNYNSKTIINTSIYSINNNNDGKKKYQSSFNKESQYKNKLNNDKPKYSYSNRSYVNTETSQNINNYNLNRTLNIEKTNKPIIPSKNIINIEPKSTIQSFSSDTNYTNTNKKKSYKTSTNTNLEEKNKNNYYQNIVEKKSYENKKRNNTPNISSRIENNNLNNSRHYISTGKRNLEKNNNQNRNNYKSVIPHNKGFKYKSNISIDENVLNNTERNYQPKQTLERKNSNSNINTNLNKNRYNFPERPKLREYGTKTEAHSFSNNKYSRTYFNNNEREKIKEIPKNKETKYKNYIVEIKKIEPKKEEKTRYAPRSFSITPSIRSGRKYGVQTESIVMNRDRNYTRNNEYEVTDITSYKKKQDQKDKYTLNKNTIPKAVKPNIKDNKPTNNIKKYSTFERSLKNIKENEKEIEKEQKSFYKNRDSSLNNHVIFISDASKNKKYYRTSTQRPAFRPQGYTLGNLSEFEVPAPKYQKYDNKKDIQKTQKDYPDRRKNKNIFNININKNNYFNAMKNLEEEIEVDDDNEQVEYLPPKSLSKIESKQNESKHSDNLNKTYQPKKENKSHYTITTITKKEDKKEASKDNKERNSKGEIKTNNITQKYNTYREQNKNINNFGYYESSHIKNPKENKFLTIHQSTKEKDNKNEIKNKNDKKPENKNEKTNQNKIINITINKPKKQIPKPNPTKNQKYIPRYIIPQHISQKPIINQQSKKNAQQIKPQSQLQQKNQILPKIEIQTQSQTPTQTQTQPQTETQKQNQQKIKSIQIQQPKPVQQVQTLKNQKEQEIKSKYQQKKEISQIKPQKQIKTQQLEVEHQEEENIEETNDAKDKENKNLNDNENIENSQENDDNNVKKSKYTSYFGDFNNNYYEIKGVSGSGEKNEKEEEEEENENENENENIKENTKKRYEKGIQLVRNINFGIQSENLCVPAQPMEDKEEKEADEQIMEEDEQNDINFENGQEMEENEGDEKKENYEENEEEGEMVGDEMINEDENGNEEYDENEMMEGEEIEENIIEENNYNEEEENNEENEFEEN